MNCPVCPQVDIPAESAACPTCGVDLAPLRRVAAARAKVAVPAAAVAAAPAVSPRPNSTSRAVLIALGVVVLGASYGAGRAMSPAAAPAAAENSTIDSLAARLGQDAAVNARREGQGLVIEFRDGLFANGADEVTSANQLRRVAALTGAHCGGCRVLVEGVTDSIPPSAASKWRTNVDLGLARARAAAKLLRAEASGVNWQAMTAGATGSARSNESEPSRARNRTVVLHVSPGTRGVAP